MKNCPFDRAATGIPEVGSSELRVSFQGGKMDAICTFMDEGRISLDEAVQYVGMEMDELEEIFENWKWFCENEEGGGV